MPDLSTLPPPPKGQTGVTLQSLRDLPPPPPGQKGMTLADLQTPATAVPTPGALVTNKGFLGNIAANVAGGLKGAFNAVTGSEQATGQDITAALPGRLTGVDNVPNNPFNSIAGQGQQGINQTNQNLAASDTAFIQAMNARRQSGQALSPAQTQLYNNILTHHTQTTAADLTPALNKTNEQVAGDFAGVGADILSAGALEGGAKAATAPAQGALQGLKQGAIAGAKAGVIPGAAYGLSGGLKANQNAGGVALSTAGGAVAGAVGGAAIGGATGALTAAPKAPQTPEQQLQDTLAVTKPTLNKKGSIAALERSGQPGGATQSGALNTYSVAPTPRDIKVAQSVQDVVSPKVGPIDNIVAVNQKIENVAQNEVRPALQANPSAFNLKTLNAYIRDNTAVPNYIKADPVLQKTYDLTRDSMLEEAAKNPKTLEGLWDSRISFDHVAENQIGSLNPADTKVSVIKQAILDTRRAVNDYIAENLPNGNAAFTAKMQQMNQMYEARANIAEANYKLLNKNVIQRWIAQNPTKAKALKIGAGLVGLGAIAGGGKELIAP